MILQELTKNLILSDNQKAVLLISFISATPMQAYETIIGNLGLISSRNILFRLGMINVTSNQLTITDLGKDELVNNNLIDENDQLTDDGRKLLSKIIPKDQEESYQ